MFQGDGKITSFLFQSRAKTKKPAEKNDTKLLPIYKLAVYLCHQTWKHLPHLISLVVKVS